ERLEHALFQRGMVIELHPELVDRVLEAVLRDRAEAEPRGACSKIFEDALEGLVLLPQALRDFSKLVGDGGTHVKVRLCEKRARGVAHITRTAAPATSPSRRRTSASFASSSGWHSKRGRSGIRSASSSNLVASRRV